MFYILHIFHVPEYKFCTTMYIRKMSRFHDFPHVPDAIWKRKYKTKLENGEIVSIPSIQKFIYMEICIRLISIIEDMDHGLIG